jgi:hypothetical protein
VDYTTAFKALQEKISYDAMDTYYDCIWDGTILEFLICILLQMLDSYPLEVTDIGPEQNGMQMTSSHLPENVLYFPVKIWPCTALEILFTQKDCIKLCPFLCIDVTQ